jgi:hypothetical protein
MAALFGLFGLALLYDAAAADGSVVSRERRRRPRAQRHRGGEAMIGLGAIAVAASLWGRDAWPYSNVAVIAGMVLVVLGALLNRPLLGELLKNRGPSRRREGSDAIGAPPGAPDRIETPPGRRPRIR